MEWLKNLLGEEYNKLDDNTINLLKGKLGDGEYILNDPTKIVPKNVFNEKNEELKSIKAENENFRKQLKDVSGMVTDEELKKQLKEQETSFNLQIKTDRENFEKEMLLNKKKNLMINELSKIGCKDSSLFVDNLDYESIQMDSNGNIVNPDLHTNALKEKYTFAFENKLTGNPLPKGDNNPKPTKQNLIEQYNKANSFMERENIRLQIENCKEE